MVKKGGREPVRGDRLSGGKADESRSGVTAFGGERRSGDATKAVTGDRPPSTYLVSTDLPPAVGRVAPEPGRVLGHPLPGCRHPKDDPCSHTRSPIATPEQIAEIFQRHGLAWRPRSIRDLIDLIGEP